MRIAIAGLHNEASGFSLHRADADFFRWFRGEELLAQYEFAAQLGAEALEDVEFVPIVLAMGGASGPVLPEVFDSLEAEVVAGLQERGPFEGIYLHMHGAVGVEGRLGAEERLLGSIRAVVGADPVVAMSMDPHGNFSRELVGYVDIASCHRFSPHIDNKVTPGRVVGQLIESIRSGIRPIKAWVEIPSLLPGERTSTAVEPGATVFTAVTDAIAREPSIIDASIWVGFAWADEPRNSAAAMASGTDEAVVRATAERLARGYWDARDDFAIVSEHVGSYDEALDFLLTSPPTPLFISDSGDNVTAGAAGDVTFALERTLAHEAFLASGATILVAGITDPSALAEAIGLGAGAVLERPIGAQLDARYAGPVPGPWQIDELIEGKQGEGIVGALLHRGPVFVTIQATRQRFVGAGDPSASHNGAPFAAIVDVEPYDAVVVKNGYLFPTQVEQSGSHFMALTPGGTDLDFDRLVFTQRMSPLFPFERDFEPALTAEVIPAWTREASE